MFKTLGLAAVAVAMILFASSADAGWRHHRGCGGHGYHGGCHTGCYGGHGWNRGHRWGHRHHHRSYRAHHGCCGTSYGHHYHHHGSYGACGGVSYGGGSYGGYAPAVSSGCGPGGCR